MKKIFLYALLLPFVFTACRKSDDPKILELTKVPVPLFKKVATTNQVISAQDPTTFNAQFTVDLYYKDGPAPQKFDIVVIKNGVASSIKTLQQGVTTFPTTITITGAQLATLFGAPIVVGDKFDIGADVTASNGQVFQAFPPVGTGYGSGVNNQPGASTFIRYEAVCQFNSTAYEGNFRVVVDEWADYQPGDIVPVTRIDATHISFKYAAFNAQPIIIAVDPNTNITSVAKQVYGNYGTPPAWPYGNISAESVPNINNFVAPCEGVVSVVLQHTVASGNFGTYLIQLKKI
jgi:hypothetical protein